MFLEESSTIKHKFAEIMYEDQIQSEFKSFETCRLEPITPCHYAQLKVVRFFHALNCGDRTMIYTLLNANI